MAIGDNYRRLAPDDQLIFNASGGVAGIRSGRSTGAEGRMLSAATADAVQSLVSEAWMSGAILALIGYAPTRVYLGSQPLWLDDGPILS